MYKRENLVELDGSARTSAGDRNRTRQVAHILEERGAHPLAFFKDVFGFIRVFLAGGQLGARFDTRDTDGTGYEFFVDRDE